MFGVCTSTLVASTVLIVLSFSQVLRRRALTLLDVLGPAISVDRCAEIRLEMPGPERLYSEMQTQKENQFESVMFDS